MKDLIPVPVNLLSLSFFTVIFAQTVLDYDQQQIGRYSKTIDVSISVRNKEIGSPKCRRLKKCVLPGGSCIEKKYGCLGTIIPKGCLSNNCVCCVPHPVCSTGCKCGIQGGFCIPKNEPCTDNDTIPGDNDMCTVNRQGLIKGLQCKCCLKPTVYMRDINNTIAYALRNRAPYKIYDGPPHFREKINKTEQQTLSAFADTLHTHLPLSTPLKTFLKCLSTNLQPTINSGKNIKGQDLENIYDNVCSAKTRLPEVREWIGCKNFDNPDINGNQAFRSFPCGVWTTFHAIAMDVYQKKLTTAAPKILPTLHGMVDYFPWCGHCRTHFLALYKQQNGKNMKSYFNVAAWLWGAHNNVSNRIGANILWEPYRPKTIFPDFKVCKDCWKLSMDPPSFSTVTNINKVLEYLESIYKNSAIKK